MKTKNNVVVAFLNGLVVGLRPDPHKSVTIVADDKPLRKQTKPEVKFQLWIKKHI